MKNKTLKHKSNEKKLDNYRLTLNNKIFKIKNKNYKKLKIKNYRMPKLLSMQIKNCKYWR